MKIASTCLSLLLPALACSPQPSRTSAGAAAEAVSSPRRPFSGILFDASEEPNLGPYIQPIAAVSNGELREPLTDTTSEALLAFREALYRPGTAYQLLVHGEMAGRAVVLAADTNAGCVEPKGAFVRREPAGSHVLEALAIAAPTSSQVARPFSLRPLTDLELTQFARLAATSLLDSGIARSSLARLQLDGAAVAIPITAESLQILVATFTAHSTSEDGPDWLLSTFIIAETRPRGLTLVAAWHHEGQDAEMASLHFLDVVDLDGRGVPVIVARGHYYESSDYQVFRRQPNRTWSRVYQGAWVGC